MSLKARLDALEKALAVDTPVIQVSWPPPDGLYETEDGQRLPWKDYVKWHVERGYPRPVRLLWPSQSGENE